jgi:hypothetical protein
MNIYQNVNQGKNVLIDINFCMIKVAYGQEFLEMNSLMIQEKKMTMNFVVVEVKTSSIMNL